MDPIPTAVGYVRSDISGVRCQWHEAQIRSLASKLGHDLRRIAIFGPETDRPMHRLRVLASRLRAEAILTPTLEHLGGSVPEPVLEVADVITVSPEETNARWIIPPDAPADMGSW
ncbi:hypothetical protein [Nocardia tengchongensis]|uniref:hypothetical protein n=1 Tax=Nocardia tengchongensis TaxID=2055889 RepID=UPI0036B162A4